MTVRRERTDEQKAAAARRSKKWRDSHPDAAKATAMRWRERNLTYYAEYMRKWRAEHPVQWSETRKKYNLDTGYYRKSHLKRYYGVTPEWYEAKLVEQGGGCALCGKQPDEKAFGNGKHLHIDHDHATGENRGLLCGSCNVALERVDNIPNWLDNLAAYLQQYG